jgi:hypothetical protein
LDSSYLNETSKYRYVSCSKCTHNRQ